jgi:hypothetical protein
VTRVLRRRFRAVAARPRARAPAFPRSRAGTDAVGEEGAETAVADVAVDEIEGHQRDAGPGAGEAREALDRVDRDARPLGHQAQPALARDEGPGIRRAAVGQAEGEGRQPAEVLDPRRRAEGVQQRGACDQHEPEPAERARDERAVRQVAEPERQVDLVGDEVLERVDHAELDRDPRMRGREGGERRQQEALPEGGAGRDADGPREPPLPLREARERAAQAREMRPDLGQGGAGRVGHHDLARRAAEQPHAEIGLEIGDDPAHHRPAEAQRTAGGGEAAPVGDGDQDLQHAEVERVYRLHLRDNVSPRRRLFVYARTAHP